MQSLHYDDKKEILSRFPNIKLSYENIVHKKVYKADMYLAIPEGVKCFAWFTVYKEKDICFIMELAENKQITNIQIATRLPFSEELSCGTILYGTFFSHLGQKLFSIEDIFKYKGRKIEYENWGNKLLLFKSLLTNDIQDNSHLTFGLPLCSNSLDDFLNHVTTHIKYRLNSIQFRSYNRSNNYLYMSYRAFLQEERTNKNNTMKNNNTTNNTNTEYKNNTNKGNSRLKRESIFKVKPDIQNDIYHLYCMNNSEEELLDIACIPDYTTSVMMNKYFRTIKENVNLDALEESDNEDEFENEKEDRFVDLEKTYNFLCKYNYKFRKWVPIRLANESSSIIDKSELVQ